MVTVPVSFDAASAVIHVGFEYDPDVTTPFVTVAALPLMLIDQVPEAPEPVVLGTSRLVRAVDAEVAPVPPLVKARVPARVTTPVVAVEGVNPVVPPLNEVTPEPPPDPEMSMLPLPEVTVIPPLPVMVALVKPPDELPIRT